VVVRAFVEWDVGVQVPVSEETVVVCIRQRYTPTDFRPQHSKISFVVMFSPRAYCVFGPQNVVFDEVFFFSQDRLAGVTFSHSFFGCVDGFIDVRGTCDDFRP
jgi:hypothetical protein